MAANYTVVASQATTQVTGPQTAVDVLRITFRTVPSGIVAYANAPYRNVGGLKVADVDRVASIFIGPLATGIERMMGSGLVAGAVAADDLDASGLVVDYIDATVAYEPDNIGQDVFSQVVRIPVHAFDEPSFYGPLVGAPIGQAYEALKALAAL